jgi:hypothetical protein
MANAARNPWESHDCITLRVEEMEGHASLRNFSMSALCLLSLFPSEFLHAELGSRVAPYVSQGYMRTPETMARLALVSVLVMTGLARAGEAPAMKSLYGQHCWFELRKAIDGRDVPPLYKDAVAAAFNESRTAEKNLDRAIKLEPRSHDAEDAHEMLADLYIAHHCDAAAGFGIRMWGLLCRTKKSMFVSH